LDLVSSESSQVGNIEDTVVGLSVLSVDTSDLHLVLVGDGLVKFWVLHQFWKVDMDGSSKTSSHVGWASGDVSEMIIVGKLGLGLDNGRGLGKSGEDLLDVRSSLHGDDSKLILFVDPDKESLGVVVVNTSSLWPLSLKTSRLEIFITTLEEEMIGNELSLLSLSHGFEGEVLTLKLTGEFREGRSNELLNLLSLGSGNGSTEWVSSKVSGNSNSSRVDHSVLISWEWWALQLIDIHGGNVLVSWLVSMVRLDNLVHEWSEGVVGIVGSSINTDTGVSPLGSREDSLSESEAELISSILALFPHISGEALLEKGSSSSWEVWETFDVFWFFEVRSHHGSIEAAFGNA